MSVKRYRHYIDPDTHCFCEMESITDGAYVTYEDYQKLQAQVKDAFRAGYTQGHNDTVEAVYCLDDELKADEYIAEQALQEGE